MAQEGRVQTGPSLRAAAAAAARVAAALTLLVQVEQSSAFGIPDFLEFGQCAPIKPVPNINFERYSGIWFNVEVVPNEYVEIVKCSMTNYTWEDDLMIVEDRGLNVDGIKMRQNSLMYPTEGQPGVLTVEADGVPNAPYVVVATDYERYSCVHSCLAMMGFRAAFSWILSRHPTIDPALRAHCRERLQELGIDTSTLIPVGQGKECPYNSKLGAVLAYSAKVQAKALARETNVHKVKVDTTATAVLTVTDHRMQDNEVMGKEVEVMPGQRQTVSNDVMQDWSSSHLHEEMSSESGCEAVTHNPGVLLLLLLLAVTAMLVTSPSSSTC